MSTRRSILVGSFAVLLLFALALWLAPTLSGKGGGDVSSKAPADDVVASLPALAEAKDGARSEREAATAGAPAASAPAGVERDGRLTVLDGGPIPPGTRVVVRYDNPDFLADFTLSELMRTSFSSNPTRLRAMSTDARARRKTGSSAEVAADGRFRIDTPRETAFYLAVDSDTLFTEEYPRRTAASTDALLVRARRGVTLRGRVETLDAKPVAGAKVLFFPLRTPGAGGRVQTPREVSDVSAADGTFTLRAAPNHLAGTVVALAASYAPGGVTWRPDDGATKALRIPMGAGARIVGRVVDPQGAPVENADVTPLAASFLASLVELDQRPPTKTRADGAFVLTDLPPGRTRLRAERDGMRPTVSAGIDLTPGTTVDVGALVLPRGRRLFGTVTKPDGSPAANATVTLTFSQQQDGLEAGEDGAGPADFANATTGDDGAFAFDGMGKGPYDFEANYPGFAPARKRRVKDEGKPIALRLRASGAIEGIVRGAAGAPLAEFEIALEVNRAAGPGFSVPERVGGKRFPAADAPVVDGRFRLEDVAPGNYSLVAKAPGYSRKNAGTIDVKSATPAQIEIDLELGVTIDGRVIDRATRKPLGGARIAAAGTFLDMFRQGAAEASSDEDGHFTLADLPAGSLTLAATHPEAARGTLSLGTPAPGARIDDVEIALGAGGALDGIAFGEDGLPMAGGLVTANAIALGVFEQVILDGDGRFFLRHLPAGSYQLWVMRGSVLADLSGSSPTDMFRGMKQATAEVKDGETTRIVIGEETGKRVKIRGRVVSRGQAVASAIVTAMPLGGDEGGRARMEFATTDAEGRFETSMPPGRVIFHVQRSGMSQSGVDETLDVPAEASFDVRIELPQGTIEGRLRGTRGEAIALAPVLLSADSVDAAGVMGAFGQALTDEEGRYVLEGLRSGSYLVSAGGGRPFSDEEPAFGRVSRRVDVREGEPTRGVDFDLRAAGAIHGTITSAAGAVAGASVFLQTIDGQALSRFSDVFTGSAGTFRARGIAPGAYRLLARGPGLALRVVEPITVEAGQTLKVDIALEPGLPVTVRVVDGDGNPIGGAQVELLDDRERRLSGFAGLAEIAEMMSGGAPAAGSYRLGTYAPGNYRLRAARAGFEAVEKSVELRGDEAKVVEVKLEKK